MAGARAPLVSAARLGGALTRCPTFAALQHTQPRAATLLHLPHRPANVRREKAHFFACTRPLSRTPPTESVGWRACGTEGNVSASPRASTEELQELDSGGDAKTDFVNKRLQRYMRKKPGWYRRRHTTVTKAQKAALRDLFPQYGLEMKYGQPLDLDAAFEGGRGEGVVLEIGFGNGEALLQMAQSNPGKRYVGVEWHKASVGVALQGIHERGLTNVRLVKGDAVLLLERFLRPGSVDEACVFFPDPWPGDRDVERRMLRPATAALLARCVRPRGRLHVATDVADYAAWTREVMAGASAEWTDLNCEATGCLEARPDWRPYTKYERRGVEELGHAIHDMCYERSGSGSGSGSGADSELLDLDLDLHLGRRRA